MAWVGAVNRLIVGGIIVVTLAVGLILSAETLSDDAPRAAKADGAIGDDLKTPGGGKVRSLHEHTNRTLIVNDPAGGANDYTIIVCSDFYANSTRDALAMWNDHLIGVKGFIADSKKDADPTNDREPFVSTDVFRFGECPTSAPSTDRVDYVSVSLYYGSSPVFNCQPTAAGCFDSPPRSGPPLSTYFGHLQVGVNGNKRPPNWDSIDNMTDGNYKKLVRTVAHELGHALGLDDYDCDPTKPVKALMMCSGVALNVYPDWAYPLQEQDFNDYAALYKPNLVEKHGNDLVEKISPTSVRFHIDATNVGVERTIEIRRRIGASWSAALATLPASHGKGARTLTNQPSGPKRYGIFSTTYAYLEGQETKVEAPTPTTRGTRRSNGLASPRKSRSTRRPLASYAAAPR